MSDREWEDDEVDTETDINVNTVQPHHKVCDEDSAMTQGSQLR